MSNVQVVSALQDPVDLKLFPFFNTAFNLIMLIYCSIQEFARVQWGEDLTLTFTCICNFEIKAVPISLKDQIFILL